MRTEGKGRTERTMENEKRWRKRARKEKRGERRRRRMAS